MLEVGKSASFGKTVTESDVNLFAGLTGDFNEIHINKVAAQNSIFGERICHGMLIAGFISAVIGMYLPGPGAIYLSQELHFLSPVKLGDTVTAQVTVTEVLNEHKGIYKLKTICKNQKEETVLDGYAVVQYKSEGKQ